jgi:hypothetical protein
LIHCRVSSPIANDVAGVEAATRSYFAAIKFVRSSRFFNDPFRFFNRGSVLLEQLARDSPTTCAREEPQLSRNPSVVEKPEHRQRVFTRQPFRFGHGRSPSRRRKSRIAV